MKTKTVFPKELTRVISEIRRVANNHKKLEIACIRYREIFAVYPHIIHHLPQNAQALLLSEQEQSENAAEISVTTPAELQKFYRQ